MIYKGTSAKGYYLDEYCIYNHPIMYIWKRIHSSKEVIRVDKSINVIFKRTK